MQLSLMARLQHEGLHKASLLSHRTAREFPGAANKFRFSDVIAEVPKRPPELHPGSACKGVGRSDHLFQLQPSAPLPTWLCFSIRSFPPSQHNITTQPKANSKQQCPSARPTLPHWLPATTRPVLWGGHVPAWCVLPAEGLLLGPSPAALKAEMQTKYRVWLVRFLRRTVVSGRKRTFTFSVSFWTSPSQ